MLHDAAMAKDPKKSAQFDRLGLGAIKQQDNRLAGGAIHSITSGIRTIQQEGSSAKAFDRKNAKETDNLDAEWEVVEDERWEGWSGEELII